MPRCLLVRAFLKTDYLNRLQCLQSRSAEPEDQPMMHRRAFLGGTLAALTAAPLLADETKKPKLQKAVKFAMIAGNGPIKDKFELIKSLGFQGVEFDSPSNVNRDEAVKAQHATGIKIHGVTDSVHWNKPLSDPLPGVRAAGLAALCTALVDAAL